MKHKFLILILLLLIQISASANDYSFENSYGDMFFSSSSSFVDSIETYNSFAESLDTFSEYSDHLEPISEDGIVIPPAPNVWANNDNISYNKFTMPDGIIGADGRLGTLTIQKIGLNVTVYEEESLESMRRGVGHFKSTSCWEGNVGLAGHNRGANAYFGRIKELTVGDEIIYKTKLGEKKYKVKQVLKINETDWTYLQRTQNNKITLVTCVENVPELRICVIAEE